MEPFALNPPEVRPIWLPRPLGGEGWGEGDGGGRTAAQATLTPTLSRQRERERGPSHCAMDH